ncbi:MAG: hypothetical protein K2Z80_17925 [Xanthobacteraceae bacterium]|nr:hypothetical protein [Xanthobacteraceae bacterium]
MRRFILSSFACAALIVAPFVDASWTDAAAASKCAKGEVWGDLGCQPRTEPSPMAHAAKRLKTRFQKAKPVPTAPAPMLD